MAWVWHLTASDCETSILEFRGMLNILSLPLLPGPLWPEVLVPVMSQIDLFYRLLYLKPFNCRANKWALGCLKMMLPTNYKEANYIYIYIYVCVCVCVRAHVCVCVNRIRHEISHKSWYVIKHNEKQTTTLGRRT